MGGLLCRGLHCAGCGKGIPAALVVATMLVFVATGLPSVLAAVATALYWLAGAVVVSAVVIAVGLVKLHGSRLQGCVVWPDDQPMYSDLVMRPTYEYLTRTGQSVPIWPDKPSYMNGGWRGGYPVLPYAGDGGDTPDADLPASSPPSPIPAPSTTEIGGRLDE